MPAVTSHHTTEMGSHIGPHSQAQLEPAGPEDGILEEDIDSSLGDDATTSTASISSSILEYRNFQGRTFHSDKYNTDPLTPNDEQQRMSIDITHHYLTLLLDGKLTLAPLKEDMEKVLDVGTGTGIWAIDFADEHPNTEVIGTDLSPIQPSWVPPNVKFEIEDATNTWSWSDNTFDLVHMRYLIGSITDWGALFKEAFRCCKPDGFVESVEVNPIFLSDDNTIASDSPINTWNKVCEEGGKAFGRSLCDVPDDVQLLRAAGFVDIQVTDFKVPVGGWAKDPKLRRVGQFLRATIENDLEGYTLMTYQHILGWPKDEYELFLVKMRKALRNGNIHGYMLTTLIDIPTVGPLQSLAPAPSLDVANDFYQGVPPSLVPILIDLYFENVYQSDLLLHKPTFLQALANQAVRPHILLSICAWGANFYRDEAGKATLKEAGLMNQWAKKAGELVFQEAEELHQDNIVTFCNLSLFWHSQGSWRISYLHKGIAPSNVATIDNDVSTGSVFAELLRGLTIWCSVVSAVRSKEANFTSRLQEIYRVENDISTWWQRVPSDMKIEVTGVPIIKQRELPKMLLVNLVYHQSLCALHSSIVPLFCWSKGDGTYSSARQLSAQVAYEHSCSISSLIRSALATDCPVSAMPLFVAYAAYSSCAIQMPFLWCLETSIKERARGNIDVNIDLLAAKSSILEFTGILRSGDSGYVKSGEESRDLSSIQPDSTALCQSPNPVVDTKLETHNMENRPLERTPHTPHTNMEQQQAVGQLDTGGNEWPTLDMFGSLLDADITSFLSMGENMDFSFLNTDVISWN
ncbi:hypothetical protein FAVG1_11284 [Fusarium avenaceum]|nr:hypothetical protein FAVG1_11284 [Fusarium avenaceum]